MISSCLYFHGVSIKKGLTRIKLVACQTIPYINISFLDAVNLSVLSL